MPSSTLVALDIPPGYLLGIDTQFFQSNDIFKGINNIPDGLHVFHWGIDQVNVRYGMFFMASNGGLVVFQWDKRSEKMLLNHDIVGIDLSTIRGGLESHLPYMINYPDNLYASWKELTSFIKSFELVERFIPGGSVSSVSTSTEENELLRKSLYESAKNRSDRESVRVEEDRIIQSLVRDDPHEIELHFTPIDLKKTWGDGMVGAEVTKHYLDKTWYLENVILKMHDFNDILAEFQLSFVLVLIFANYSAAVHWKKIAELFLRCISGVGQHPQRYLVVLHVIDAQMKQCPPEYIDDFFERTFIANLYLEFSATVNRSDQNDSRPSLKSSVRTLGDTLVSRFGLDISEGSNDLGFNNHDTENEEEPAVVIET